MKWNLFIYIFQLIQLRLMALNFKIPNFSLFHFQNKPLAVQPIDFESFVAKNKTLIQNDPQRELLIYPNDDVSVSEELCQLLYCYLNHRTKISFWSCSKLFCHENSEQHQTIYQHYPV